MDRFSLASKNVLVGIFDKIILLLLPFGVRTVIIHYLGLEYVGLSGLFTAIFTMLNLTELGLGSAIVYQMYKPYAEKKYDEVNSLLSFYKIIYRYIGLIIGLLGLLIIPFLKIIIKSDVPNDINIYFLYIVYLVNVCSSYWLFAYKVSILNVSQNTRVKNNIDLIVFSAQYVVQIIILILFKNYSVYVVTLPIFTVLDNLVVGFISKKRFPQFYAAGTLSDTKKTEIRSNSVSLIGHKIGATIITSADNIVISSFLGLVILGKYSNYYYVMYTVITLLSIIYFALLPTIGNLLVTKDINSNLGIFYSLSFCNTWLIGWCTICLVCLYQHFIIIWAGENSLFGIEMVILFAVNFYVWKVYDNVSLYKDAAGIWKEDRNRPYIASIVNLLVNIILVKFIGVVGVQLSTIISVLLINIPWSAVVLMKRLFNTSAQTYFFSQAKQAVVTVIVCATTYWFCSVFKGYSIQGFFLKTVVCMIFPNVLFYMCYRNSKEFKMAKTFLKSKLSRF